MPILSFALKRIRRAQVRKGMVLIGRTETPPKGRLHPFSR
jgi:GTPase